MLITEDKIELTSDYAGMEPVFYMQTPEGLCTSSDITELIRKKGSAASINRDALKMYLVFQYVPTLETIVKGICRLPPGGRLNYSKETGLKITHRPFPAFSPDGRSLEESVLSIREAVSASVSAIKPSSGKTGCFLSGGVDSGYLAALLKPDLTFTFAFDAPGCDESAEARELSTMIGAENRCRYISSDDFFAALPEVMRIIGQPYANLTAPSLFYLAEFASREVTAVFSGEGPDELFGGYEQYRVGRSEAFFRKVPLPLRKLAARLFSGSGNHRLSRFLRECASETEEIYIGQTDVMTEKEADSLLAPACRSCLSRTDITGPVFREIKSGSALDKKQYLDLCLWAPFDNILSLSLLCRHFGLKLLTPYLSPEVTRTALSLKEEYRACGMETKIAFRKAASICLPPENCDRPKKSMPLPYGTWFQKEKYLNRFREAFSDPSASEFFNSAKLFRLLEDYRRGKTENAKKIYAVYCFLLWYREVFLKCSSDTDGKYSGQGPSNISRPEKSL